MTTPRSAPLDSMTIPADHSGPIRVTRRLWSATHSDFKVPASKSLSDANMLMLRKGEAVGLYFVEIVG